MTKIISFAVPTQAKIEAARLERIWTKIDGKLVCVWVDNYAAPAPAVRAA